MSALQAFSLGAACGALVAAAAVRWRLTHGWGRGLQQLSSRALAAREDERERIARDLHDETVQTLARLSMDLERLEKRAAAVDPSLAGELATDRRLAHRGLQELRALIRGLRPSALEDLGLVPAVRSYARATLEPMGVQVAVDAPSELLPTGETRTAAYRIVEEAVTNIQRHAAARSVSIRLWQEGDRLLVRVQDDGRGFDVDKAAGLALLRGHFGLIGMRERARALGGRLEVRSSVGGGTTVMVSLPATKAPPGAGTDDTTAAG